MRNFLGAYTALLNNSDLPDAAVAGYLMAAARLDPNADSVLASRSNTELYLAMVDAVADWRRTTRRLRGVLQR